jgi:hypothetical protein
MDNSERLYTFRDNSRETRGFTWAMSIIPQSAMTIESCPHCTHYAEYPSGEFDVIVEGGVKYPDVLGCGAYSFLIVSDKVINAWHGAGITSFHTFRVGVADVRSAKLSILIPPPYYGVEIDGRCRVDLAASGFEIVQSCPACGHVRTTRRDLNNSFVMVKDSWDHSSLFRDLDLFPRVIFCTRTILDVAQRNGITNFRFQPMQAGSFSDKGIDFMRGKR